MKLAEGALNKVVNRPFLLIFAALFSLAYTMIDIINPLIAIAFGFSSIGNGDLLGSVISLLQTILAPKLLLSAIKWVLPGLLIISLIISPLLAGYFYILNNSIRDLQKQNSEFLTGIKIYFKKIFRINLTISFIGLLFILFVGVIIVPSLFTTWSWKAGKSELQYLSIFLSLVTLFVVFFAVMFFKLYVLYWYPSVYNFENKPFIQGKETVDQRFWSLMGRWVLIDIIFIILESLFLYFRYRISLSGDDKTIYTAILFAGKFTFNAAFFTWAATFIFASFNSIKKV